MTQPNGAAAVAAANQSTSCPKGMCLSVVQNWWGISPHAWPSASSQWANTIQHGNRAIPLGAPVFYSGGNGHIAIYIGNGLIRSTDAPSNYHVANVPLDWPSHAWGKPFVGWGSKLAGAVLNLSAVVALPAAPAGAQVYVSKLHYGQTASDSVSALQSRLNAIKYPPFKNVPVTGNYFAETDASVRAWQAWIGDHPDTAGRSSIGPRQAARLWAGTGVTIHP